MVDVALVYYLIYRLLLTIRGTRAAQMIVGIVLIGAAFFVAVRVELTTVSWLLDNFISYFIILIIVVFQQDIRRALGRIGQNLMPFGRRQEATHTVDEVVAACAQLARARMGAIIVFERDAALEEFVDDATRIDAVLSRQILVSLFGQRAPRWRGRHQQEPPRRARACAASAVTCNRPRSRVRYASPRSPRHHRGYRRRRRGRV
jgi:diadenylate cyclase